MVELTSSKYKSDCFLLLVLTAAWWYGVLLVFLRVLSLYNLHVFLSPFYLGVVTCIQSFFIMIFMPNLLHMETYDIVDVFFLWVIGIFGVAGQLTMMLASRAAQASWMAPITYLENVFTLMADIWLFHYHFGLTDVIGMLGSQFKLKLCLNQPSLKCW